MGQNKLEKLNKSLKSLVKNSLTQPETLGKGAMRRLFPQDPQSLSEADEEAVARWQRLDAPYSEEPVSDQELREEVPEMTPEVRARALNKLMRHTKVKTDPETNKRHFLLHRGMSLQEHNKTVKDGKYTSETKTSWTPMADIANNFHHKYKKHVGHPDHNPTPWSHAAWVPEDAIRMVPKQLGAVSVDPTEERIKAPNRYEAEHEVVVEPGTFDLHPLSGRHDFSFGVDKTPNIDEVISRRGETQQAAPVFSEARLREIKARQTQKSEEMSGDTVKIPKKEFLREHNRLIKILRSKSHKDDLKEASKQAEELATIQKSPKLSKV